jgi:hypothetical protein
MLRSLGSPGWEESGTPILSLNSRRQRFVSSVRMLLT